MEILLYLLRASLCLIVFFLFYRWALQQEKAFVFNRYYLLGGLGLSLTLPFINPTIYLPAFFFPAQETVVEPVQLTMAQLAYLQANPIPTAAEVAGPDYALWATGLILLISALLVLRFLFQLGRIIDLINSNPIALDGRTRYVLIDGDVLPHSFFHYVFVNKHEFRRGVIQPEIIRHEKAHGDQRHSADIVLVEFLRAVFWFNPVMLFYKRSIQLNHEFLADDHVIRDTAIHQYQHTLLSCITSNREPVLVSHFNYSFTKKRLIMMSKLRTSNWKLASRMALLMPILLMSFIISANCQEAKAEPPVEKKVEVEVKEEIEEEVLDDGKVEKKVIRKEVYKVDGKEVSKDEALKLMKEKEAQKEQVLKQKMMILEEESEELEDKLEELLEGLEDELEGLEIDAEELKMKLEEKGMIELERKIGDAEKRIQVITKEFEDMDDMDFDFDFDFDFDGEETMFKVRKGHAEQDGEGNIFIMDGEGEVIEIRDGSGNVKVIRIGGEEEEDLIWIENMEDQIKKEIRIEIDDEIEKQIEIINSGNDDSKEIKKQIIVIDGDDDEVEKQIEIIIRDETDGKKKKKKKRK